MSKSSKKGKQKINVEANQNKEPSFEDNLDLFFDILSSPRGTRSHKQCEDVKCAIKKTKFYKIYETALLSKPQVMDELAQGMSCECFRANSKIFDENQIAKKVYIIMEGEVVIMSNYINKIYPKVFEAMQKAKAKQMLKQAMIDKATSDPKKKPKKPPPKSFDERYPLQERFGYLYTSDFFGDTDLRYSAQYSFSAVTKKNTHVATIPIDIFSKYLADKCILLFKRFLDNQYIELCLKFATEITVHIGSTIFKEGDISSDLYYIKDGEVEFSMNPCSKLEKERKKLKDIQVKFEEHQENEDCSEEIKFEINSLLRNALYEKGQSIKHSKLFWSLDDSSQQAIKSIKLQQDSFDSQKQRFQERGLLVFKQDDQDLRYQDEVTDIMLSSVSQKLKNEKMIKDHKIQGLASSLERHEGNRGFNLYVLSQGEYFGEEEIFSDCQTKSDFASKFSKPALKILSLSGSELVPEDVKVSEEQNYRKMTAKCISSSCTLLKLSYKLFLNLVCLSHKELLMLSTLLETTRKEWSKNKIQGHVEKLRDLSQRSTNQVKKSVTTERSQWNSHHLKSNQDTLFQASSSASIEKSLYLGSVSTTSLSQQQIKQPEHQISSIEKIIHNSTTLDDSNFLTTSPPKNKKFPQQKVQSELFSPYSNSPLLKPKTIEQIPTNNISIKRKFKVSLDQTEEDAIHSPMATPSSQSQQKAPLNTFSKFFDMQNSNSIHNSQKNYDVQNHDIISNRTLRKNSIQPLTPLPRCRGENFNIEKYSTLYKMNSPYMSLKSQEFLQSPLSTFNQNKSSLPFLIKLPTESIQNQDEAEEQVQKLQLNIKVNQKYQERPFFNQDNNLSIQNKPLFFHKLNIQTQQDDDDQNDLFFSKSQNLILDSNITSLRSIVKRKSNCQNEKNPIISSTGASTFAFQHALETGIHKSDSFFSAKKDESSKNYELPKTNFEIDHDIISKKYQNTQQNETKHLNKDQVKPWSFQLLSDQNYLKEDNNFPSREKNLLQLLKKHQVQPKLFKTNQSTNKINNLFNKSHQNIQQQNKEVSEKIKVRNKNISMNIKSFCDEITKQVIEQEERDQKEKEEASNFFNFTIGGKFHDINKSQTTHKQK